MRIGTQKINFSLITLSFISITILILAGGYYAYLLQENAILERSHNEITAIKNLKVEQIVEWRKERIGDAKVILQNPLLTDDLKLFVQTNDKKTKENILTWFRILKKSYKYEDLILFDKNFDPLLSDGTSDDYSLDHFQENILFNDRDSVYISPLHKTTSGKIHYSIGISFYDKQEIFAHLLFVLNPNNFLYPLIQKWPTPSKTAETILVRREGDSLLFLNELRHQSGTAMNFKLPLRDSTLPAAQAVQGKEGFFRGIDYRGEKVLSDIGSVPGTRWFVIAKIDEEEILNDLKTALINSIILVVLLLAISYLVIFSIMRRANLKSFKTEIELQKDKVRLSNLYATLSQINQAIVREQSKSELLLTITTLPVKFGNFKACALCLRESESESPKVESFTGAIDYFHSILTDNSEFRFDDPSLISLQNSETVICNNLNSKAGEWQALAIKSGIKSCASAPIDPFGNTIASLTLYSEEEDFFKDPEIKLIEEITSDIAFSLELTEKNIQRRKIEKQIQENERRLAILFSNLPGIAYRCAFNKEYTMEFLSEGTLPLTGYTPQEILNEKLVTYEDLILPEDREYVWNEVEKCVENKTTYTLVYRIVNRDNKVKWVWERGLALYDAKGNVEALEGFISDITERKIAEQTMILAKEQAEASEKLKSDFLAQMSHEIRTPVNVILSFSSLIKGECKNEPNEDLKISFDAIEHAGQRLIRTIDSILNMAQITSGSFDVKPVEFDLYKDVLIPIHKEFRALAESKNISFTLENNCKSTIVLGDRYSLSQIFANLIDNALKYTAEGFVKVILSCDEKNISVSVQDSGVGISEEFIPNLFSAFSQEETGYSRTYEGSGLGLALVKNYCTMNKAEISVTSKKREGTTFTVTMNQS